MLYRLYVIGFYLARAIPIKIGYVIAEVIALGYYIFARRDRRELRANLRIILGEDTKKRVLNKHIFSIFKHFAKYLVDFFRTDEVTEEFLAEKVEIKGLEILDKCLSENKGAIILSIHIGNWELGAAVVGALNYPLKAIVLEHDDKRINDFFVQKRALNKVKSIGIGATIKACFKALKENKFVAIVGDKNYTSNGIYVDFFGRKAFLPKGPAVFHLKTGAPIVFSAMIRNEDDTFTFYFDGPIKYEPTGDHKKDIKAVMDIYIKYFEKYVRDNVDQWYAFRKIWNQE